MFMILKLSLSLELLIAIKTNNPLFTLIDCFIRRKSLYYCIFSEFCEFNWNTFFKGEVTSFLTMQQSAISELIFCRQLNNKRIF